MTIIDTTLEPKTLDDLEAKVTEKVIIEPTLTAETVDKILVELKTPQGYGDIARKVGFDKCTKAQVVEIAQKRLAKITELTSAKAVEPIVEPIIK